jgi:hypothetical protein
MRNANLIAHLCAMLRLSKQEFDGKRSSDNVWDKLILIVLRSLGASLFFS